MEERDAARVAPSDADLERAIASVPGVVNASVGRSGATGRSRLRIRLAAGEDPEKVSWAVAATLRERFSIALDPDDIRPREVSGREPADPSDDPVHLVRSPGLDVAVQDDPTDEHATSASDGPSVTPTQVGREVLYRGSTRPAKDAVAPVPSDSDMAETRERLSSAAREALAGLRDRFTAGDDLPSAADTDVEPEPTVEPDLDHEQAGDVEQAGDAEAGTDAEAVADEHLAPEAEQQPARPDDVRTRSLRRRSHVGRPWPVSPRDPEPPAPEPPPADVVDVADPVAPIPPPDGQVDHDPPTAQVSLVENLSQPEQPASGQPAPAAVGSEQAATRPDPGVGSERAAIRHLDTSRHERDVRVTATLEHAGRSARGEATTVPTSHGMIRAVAEATIAALGALVGPGLIAGVDRVCVQPADDPANALVTVSLVTDRGEETLLGTSVVRGDPDRAVMRATLDALNRRVAELFPPFEPPPAGDPAN